MMIDNEAITMKEDRACASDLEGDIIAAAGVIWLDCGAFTMTAGAAVCTVKKKQKKNNCALIQQPSSKAIQEKDMYIIKQRRK